MLDRRERPRILREPRAFGFLWGLSLIRQVPMSDRVRALLGSLRNRVDGQNYADKLLRSGKGDCLGA